MDITKLAGKELRPHVFLRTLGVPAQPKAILGISTRIKISQLN